MRWKGVLLCFSSSSTSSFLLACFLLSFFFCKRKVLLCFSSSTTSSYFLSCFLLSFFFLKEEKDEEEKKLGKKGVLEIFVGVLVKERKNCARVHGLGREAKVGDLVGMTRMPTDYAGFTEVAPATGFFFKKKKISFTLWDWDRLIMENLSPE